MLKFARDFFGLYFAVATGLASVAGFILAARSESMPFIYLFVVTLVLSCGAYSFKQSQLRKDLDRELQNARSENKRLHNLISQIPIERLNALHNAVSSAVAESLRRQLGQHLRKIRRLVTFSSTQVPYPLKPIELKNADGTLYLSAKCTSAAANQVRPGDTFVLKETINGVEQKVAGLAVNQPVNEKGHLVLCLVVPYDKKTVESLRHMSSKADWTASKLRDYVVVLTEDLPEWEVAAIDNAIDIVNTITLPPSKEKE